MFSYIYCVISSLDCSFILNPKILFLQNFLYFIFLLFCTLSKPLIYCASVNPIDRTIYFQIEFQLLFEIDKEWLDFIRIRSLQHKMWWLNIVVSYVSKFTWFGYLSLFISFYDRCCVSRYIRSGSVIPKIDDRIFFAKYCLVIKVHCVIV